MWPPVLLDPGAAPAAETPPGESTPTDPPPTPGETPPGEIGGVDLAGVLESLRSGTVGEGEQPPGEGEGEAAPEGDPPADPPAKPAGEPDPDHFTKVQLREQRKLTRQLQEQLELLTQKVDKPGESTTEELTLSALPPITIDAMTDPKQFQDYLEARDQKILDHAQKVNERNQAELHGKVDPMISEREATRAMRDIYSDSTLGASLLQKPEVISYLTNLKDDPAFAEAIKSPLRIRTEAALFRALTKLDDAQRSVRKSAPAPKRRENAGMTGPPSGGGGPKPPKKNETNRERIKKLSPDAAWAEMQTAAKSIGAI